MTEIATDFTRHLVIVVKHCKVPLISKNAIFGIQTISFFSGNILKCLFDLLNTFTSQPTPASVL